MLVKEKNASQTASKRVSELTDEKTKIDTSLKEERLKAENLQVENDSLKVKLQAKLEAKAKAQEAAKVAQTQVKEAPRHAAPIAAVSGSKADWLAASGIPQSDWAYVDSIVQRESGWNPNAVNKSSGACGLGQQLPCGKWAGAWNDPVAALKAQHGYVKERYGSYAGAVAFWNANHWY
jgi:soluble lytic murein transglycosylase-like protein